MQTDVIEEARRQAQICNSCRYCEGYCSVFPAMHANRAFSDGDLTQLANLCHNCRGCYYACQYTAPHEFDLNLPRALAELRQDSWKQHAWPRGFANLVDRAGLSISIGLVAAVAALFWLAQWLKPEQGEGFYAYMSHGLMVAIFAPAFVLPLSALALSLRSFWKSVSGAPLRWLWTAPRPRHRCARSSRLARGPTSGSRAAALRRTGRADRRGTRMS